MIRVVVLCLVAAAATAQTSLWGSCSNVIAIPGNPSSATTTQCQACNNGAQAWWPCDQRDLCYCATGTIPPEYVLPFTYCNSVIAVAGNSNGVQDSECTKCNKGEYRWYPCDQPNVLCKCSTGNTPGGSPATTTTTRAPTPGTPPSPPSPPSPTPPPATTTTRAPTTTTKAPATTLPPAPPPYACVAPTSVMGSTDNNQSVISTVTRAMPRAASTAEGDNVARVKRLFPQDKFNYLFSRSNKGTGPTSTTGPYSYDAFVQAVGRFPDFCNRAAATRGVSVDNTCLVELSTLFAHFVQETGENTPGTSTEIWRQALYWYDEYGCDAAPAQCNYRQESGWSATAYPPATGKQYFGRGPFQLSWNYNYGPFSKVMFNDASVLLNNPEYVSSSDAKYSWLAFASALWFYMTPATPKPSMHDVVTGMYVPTAADKLRGNNNGFGATIMIINGALECGFASAQAANRVSAYGSICNYFGVSAACNYGPTTCDSMQQFASSTAVPNIYWDRDWSSSCACKLASWMTAYPVVMTSNINDGYTQCMISQAGCGDVCPRVSPTTAAPTTTAAPLPSGSGSLKLPFGNTLGSFGIGAAPTCATQYTPDSTCGGFDYGKAVCMSQAFYMAQAGGSNVGGQEWRGKCYSQDGGSKNLTLGWFDAGDYVKFGLPMAYSAAALAWGALEFPNGYADGSPQRLALLYNLRVFALYILEGWDPVNVKLIAQIGDGNLDHGSWYACKAPQRTEARPAQYITKTCPGSEVAGDTASALAAIALVLKKFEGTSSSAFQTKLATTALEIYSFATTYKGSYTNCVNGAASFYASYSGYGDELAFAGTWMQSLKAEGLISTTTDFLAQAKANYGSPSGMDWDNKMLGAAVRLYQLTKEDKFKSDVAGRVAYYTGSTMPKTTGGLWKIMQWGALRHAANAAFIVRLSAVAGIVSDTYSAAAKRQLDYILGLNPNSMSYLVGFGDKYPKNPHHRGSHDSPTGSIGSPAVNNHVLVGALVGGPYDSDSYPDDRNDYVTGEVATDYNALFTGLAAAFTGLNCDYKAGATPAPAPPTTLTPRGPATGSSQFTVGVVKLETWWLQVTVDPTPARIDIWYNGAVKTAMEGPKWGSHWTGAPSEAVNSAAEIAIDIYATASTSSPAYRVIKEGSLKLSVNLAPKSRRMQNAPDSFDSEAFSASIALALGIETSRVFVDDRYINPKTNVTEMTVRILPLGMMMYTDEAAARGVSSSSLATNKKLSIALSDSSSAERTALATQGVTVQSAVLETMREETTTEEPTTTATTTVAPARGDMVVLSPSTAAVIACLVVVGAIMIIGAVVVLMRRSSDSVAPTTSGASKSTEPTTDEAPKV